MHFEESLDFFGSEDGLNISIERILMGRISIERILRISMDHIDIESIFR